MLCWNVKETGKNVGGQREIVSEFDEAANKENLFCVSSFCVCRVVCATISQPPLGGCALAGISSPHPRQRLQDRAVQLCTKQIIYHFVSVYDLRPQRGGGLKSAAENRSDSPPLPDVAKTWRRMKAKYKEILMIQSSVTVYFLFVKT